ncbi:MAG: 5'-3' exonuclease H3TH domain-containing protein [bacterium]|nr:5'-3' exonuclease H3TH domain-containing protein [bacterium]
MANKTLLLFDANALIHRFFHALPPLTTPDGKAAGAIYGLSGALLKIFRDQKPEYVAAAFDRPEKTFRAVEFKDYKAHRPPAVDELVEQIIQMPDVFDLFGVKRFSQAGYEADDVIGTLVEKFKDSFELDKIIIVSGDLDVLQLVEDDKVLAQISKTGISEVVLYNKAGVIERYGLRPDQLTDLKGFLGDTSDNIPGVKGIGPKTITPLLQEFGNIEELFDNIAIINPKIVKKLEGHKDEALFSKKLATIKRDVPMECSLDDLKAQPLNKEELKKYFNKLGFNSLVTRVDNA